LQQQRQKVYSKRDGDPSRAAPAPAIGHLEM